MNGAMDESEDTSMMWGYGFDWLSMTLMMLGSTLWIVVLVVLVWALIRWLNKRTVNPTRQAQTLSERGPTAMEILRQRYARGEIDGMTFEQMRERLEASDKSPRGSQPEPAAR
jgi:putative membrane protein